MTYSDLNISANAENVFLEADSQYYLIDALYADNIRTARLTQENFENNIKEKIFPYTETPYLKLYTRQGLSLFLKLTIYVRLMSRIVLKFVFHATQALFY